MSGDYVELVGYTPYAERDGFAQPVFDFCGEKSIQIPDARELIIADFAPVDIVDLTEVDRQLSARRGDFLIYCFKAQGAVIIGSVDQIRNDLLEIADRMDDEAIKLQVAEVIGDHSDAAIHRRKLSSIYLATLGQGAESMFLRGSVFPDVLWRSLINSIHDPEYIQKVMNNRNWILHQANPSQEMFSAELIAWLRSELHIDPARLSEKVASYLDPGFLSSRKSDRGNGRETLRLIAALPRQEMRIMELLRAIIDDPTAGKALLMQFQDVGQFANNAAEFLRHHDRYLFPRPDPAFLNHLVSQLYAMVYPKRRGVLMRDMANTLGHIEPIADGIARRLNTSTARDVRQHHAAIADALTRSQRLHSAR